MRKKPGMSGTLQSSKLGGVDCRLACAGRWPTQSLPIGRSRGFNMQGLGVHTSNKRFVRQVFQDASLRFTA